MKISNIRLGLATNSSSSHSVIFVGKDQPTPAEESDGRSFGWDNFTLSSPEMKTAYLAQQMYENLQGLLKDERVAAAVVRDVLGPEQRVEKGSVDHQSVWDLPLNWDGTDLHPEFVQEMQRWICRPDVVILGGNDNSDPHPLQSVYRFTRSPLPRGDGQFVARQDGAYWTFFNRHTGGKIRFTFQDDAPNYTKASAPELVDLKITDYCDIGCPFCYQNSTTRGKHAVLEKLNNVAYALGQLQVFEVALGGGETTSHPNFAEILAEFRHWNVVPNFTTKSLAWMRNPEIRRSVREHAGAFAYSAGSVAEVRQLIQACQEHDFTLDIVNVQLVMGTLSREDYEAILEVAAASRPQLRVTCLGFKQVGRGQGFKIVPYEHWWLSSTEKLFRKHYQQISIDTALAREFQAQLVLSGVPQYMFHVDEGKFSMYIDAVAGQCGPSSYEPQSLVPIDLSGYQLDHQLRERFLTF